MTFASTLIPPKWVPFNDPCLNHYIPSSWSHHRSARKPSHCLSLHRHGVSVRGRTTPHTVSRWLAVEAIWICLALKCFTQIVQSLKGNHLFQINVCKIVDPARHTMTFMTSWKPLIYYNREVFPQRHGVFFSRQNKERNGRGGRSFTNDFPFRANMTAKMMSTERRSDTDFQASTPFSKKGWHITGTCWKFVAFNIFQ